jgi:hypothetical protein
MPTEMFSLRSNRLPSFILETKAATFKKARQSVAGDLIWTSHLVALNVDLTKGGRIISESCEWFDTDHDRHF